MKTNNPTKKPYLLCCSLLLLLCCTSFAQKLPNIQTGALLIPPSLKIDGKLTEWNDLLQAFNRHTQIYYTIANNDQNLYIGIKSTDKVAIGRILASGLSFSINKEGNKKGPGIMYPIRDLKMQLNTSSYLDAARIPSLILQAKEIKVLNVAGITDSLLSIYNEYNIKPIITYNNGLLIYELNIPLKFIGELKSFSYNITLNGLADSPLQDKGVPPPPPGLPANRSPSSLAGLTNEMRFPTYLQGTYTLIK